MVFVQGKAFEGQITKELVQSLPKGKIVILHHEDIDSTAALSLINKKVKAILNFNTSMTGNYNHDGVYTLLQEGVAVFDIVEIYNSNYCLHKSVVRIWGEFLMMKDGATWIKIARLKKYNFALVQQLRKVASIGFREKFNQFASNSIHYATKEIDIFSKGYEKENPLSWLEEENVLIVVRGPNFEKDLDAAWSRLKNKKVKVIAVDGAADSLLNLGIIPEAIIGDMDSVSEKALRSGARLYAHTYENGISPGEERIRELGIPFTNLKFIGTSEDVAIIFSYWANAKRIFVIGSHFSMTEFLEKGRMGMGSSLLVRMQSSHKIIDLKGYHHLQSEKQFIFKWSALPAAMLLFAFTMNFNKVQLLLTILWDTLKVGV